MLRKLGEVAGVSPFRRGLAVKPGMPHKRVAPLPKLQRQQHADPSCGPEQVRLLPRMC
jgi:hypothetical protein